MKYLLLLTVMFSTSVFANKKLTKDEFLKLYDKGRIQFEIMPMMKQTIQAQLMQISKMTPGDSGKVDLAVLTGIEKEMIKEFQRQYKYFDPEMLNLRYVDDNGYRYSFFFEFNSTRMCKFRADKLDMSCGNPVCSENVDPAKSPNVDMAGTVIPDSYCEKAYRIKIIK